MQRHAISDLKAWASSSSRRPLVLRGARQVGKTWLVEHFAREHIGAVATLNLERHPRAAELFADPSPQRNLAAIETLLGQRIEPGRCVLFLDEVQVAPQVLGRLRYFHEELPDLHVVAAGSLLDFALADPAHHTPVGRIEYLHLEPLAFDEFAAAVAGDPVVAALRNHQLEDRTPGPVHDKLLGLCREYSLVGGMPAVVDRYRQERSLVAVAPLLHALLQTLRDDFAKYAGRVPTQRLQKVFDGAARLVGRKFVYSQIDRDDRAAPLREALEALCRARVCHRVHCVHGNGLPFAAERHDREFKVMLLDTGLYLAALGVPLGSLSLADPLQVQAGALAEHLVGQLLRSTLPRHSGAELQYWSRSAHSATAELDYLTAVGTTVVPIEVKAGKPGSLRSLHRFVAEKRAPIAVRIHSEPPLLSEVTTSAPDLPPQRFHLLSLPFYLVGELPRLLVALAERLGVA